MTRTRLMPLALLMVVLHTARGVDDEGLEKAMQREATAQAVSYASPELMEGINAIVEKRSPKF